MARRSSVRGVLGRPPFVAALGVLGMLFVVWGAAAPGGGWPDPARGGPVHWARVDSENFIFKSGCGWLCLPGPPGAGGMTTSDIVGAVLGWTVVAVVALSCLFVGLRAVLDGLRSRDDRRPPVGDAADLDLDALAQVLSADAGQRLEALSSGPPAQGIIAAWARLEARWSRHPLTEDHRARAAAAYRALDADLRAIVTARTSPPPPPVWLG